MTLATWQSSLANLVLTSVSEHCGPPDTFRGDLSPRECAWLESVSTTAGFTITCHVQRWWREFRVQLAAPLTLAALPAEVRDELIADYIRQNRRPSSYFLREALPFLDLCRERASDVPHVTALATFERGMLILGEAVSSGSLASTATTTVPTSQLEAHPLADVVAFSAPPAHLLVAAARGLPLPDRTESEHWVLLAPGLPNLARASTPEEARVLRIAKTAPIPPTIRGVQELWTAGALRACEP